MSPDTFPGRDYCAFDKGGLGANRKLFIRGKEGGIALWIVWGLNPQKRIVAQEEFTGKKLTLA